MNLLHKMMTNKVIRYAYTGWLVIAMFYFYQYVLRVAPGIMVEDIRETFRVTAEEFATLGALSLFAYGILQIPIGIIVDQVGVRKVCIVSITIIIVGAFVMAITESFMVLQASRLIIGAGSGAAFLCTIKFVADHVPNGSRGLLMGATLTLGMAGAICFSKLLAILDNTILWQHVIMSVAIMGIVVLVLIALVLKNTPGEHINLWDGKGIKSHYNDLLRLASTPKIIVFSLLAIGLYTPISALADLWGPAFLKQKFGLSKSQAAELAMLLYVGLGIGSFILPWLSEKYNVLNIGIIVCIFALLGAFSILLYSENLSIFELKCVLFAIGFFCGAEMMCFTGALENSTQHDSGHIIGIVNTFNMLGGALIQQTIGFSLDNNWNGMTNAYGIRQYSPCEFRDALGILAVVIAFCAATSIVLLLGRRQKV
jgi:sugar phosphate permease